MINEQWSKGMTTIERLSWLIQTHYFSLWLLSDHPEQVALYRAKYMDREMEEYHDRATEA